MPGGEWLVGMQLCPTGHWLLWSPFSGQKPYRDVAGGGKGAVIKNKTKPNQLLPLVALRVSGSPSEAGFARKHTHCSFPVPGDTVPLSHLPLSWQIEFVACFSSVTSLMFSEETTSQ